MQPPHHHRMVREIAYGYVEEAEYTRVDLAARILAAVTTYQDRYCMGVRDIDPNNPKNYVDSYSWQTFKTIGERITNFSHGLRRLIKPRGYLGICAANRPEWLVTDFACILQSFITVPIYCLFNDREIAFIIKNTPVSIIVCDKEMLPRFIRLHSECPSLRHIVCMDPIPEAMSKINGLSIHYMGTIERYGSMKRYDYVITAPDDCITVIYTSGSLGFPKGAMISENAFKNNFPRLNITFRDERIKFCYRPLAWATDREGSIAVFLEGGRIGFSTGDVTRLMEELALVRPTSFSAPPTIWNKIYAEYKATLSLMTTDQSTIDVAMAEETLLQQFAKLIPIRCKILSIGGAMVSSTVLDFMKRCFRHCQIMESYGTTECGSITFDNLIEMTIDYRLESVPEMCYTLDDKPFPRGELLVKTKTMFSGYMNNPEETKMAFTDDGFFHTGDIVELRRVNDGQLNLRVIDRKKNFFKLSQGQFVSPEFLQEIYMQSPFVEQMYIHGNPLEDSVVAVIVPNKEYARAFAIKHNLTEFDNSRPDKLFYDAIMQDLRLLATKESLRKHEIPSRLIIDFEPFTSENGLLTSSMKLCRYRLAAHYADRLKAVESIEDRLKSMIEKATGHQLAIDQATNFISIGGDSLSAVRLSHCIQENMIFLQLWNEEFRDRIIALRGDLAQEHFGLDNETYSELANQIDIIFHCGATVNFILPYNKLYSSNVSGTLEVIRLATHTATSIPVQYISTISVLPSEMKQEVHIDEISPNHLKSGYAQSKWVAEKLIAKANRLGLPVNIYRLGSIWGNTETGACNQNDINTLLLAAIMKTGCYPTTASNIKLNGLPANLAAQSIVFLSHIQPNIYGKTYNIIQSNEGISFQNIIENIQNCGITLVSLSYDEWKVKLMSQSATKRPFESIVEFFTNNPFERMSSSQPSSSNILQLTFPAIDDVYIMKWLTFILNNIVH
ncbi:unnamed protein product [Rotaria sordida]|uniref:long-chain-fatty-acid--CoA ligase n=2 Tax=Rotaria sordida TaxID=392033 RepID=A0A814UID4_9BILA|nr:unnamed protein product [Rotaria sordida]